MAESTVPEILRVNLTSSVLSLKCLGVDDVLAFEYLEAPKPEQIKASLRTLYLLQALLALELPEQLILALTLTWQQVKQLPSILWTSFINPVQLLMQPLLQWFKLILL